MTMGSVVVGGVAVYTAIHNNSRALNAQIFLTYSDRLQSIRRSMREDLMTTRLSSPDCTAERVIPTGAIETLHLIFELYQLKGQGYVKTSIWAVWCRDIDRFLRASIIRQGHQQLKDEFEGHPMFIRWIEERQALA
jgi:hypothetical protein